MTTYKLKDNLQKKTFGRVKNYGGLGSFLKVGQFTWNRFVHTSGPDQLKHILFWVMGILVYVQVAGGDTNLGTINTVRNGFATIKECENKPHCSYDKSFDSLTKEATELAALSKCVASHKDYEKAGVEVPKCPKDMDDLKGLDNTYPTGGIFALLTYSNSLFLKDLMSNFLKNDKVGKFNLVVPKSNLELIQTHQPELANFIEKNSDRVNIIKVETMPKVDQWMQDSFQFTTLNGKPALYQLEHYAEREGLEGDKLQERLACTLAKECNIPYYVPPDMVDPNCTEINDQNSGGNLEVLPGGTFLTGVKPQTEWLSVGSDGTSPRWVPEQYRLPIEGAKTRTLKRSQFQEIQKKSLEESGNKVLEIDVSFLNVGHVDETVNFVKTNGVAPCDFAVLMASPEKAFELISARGKTRTPYAKADCLKGGLSPCGAGYADFVFRPLQKVISLLFMNSSYAGFEIIPSEPLVKSSEPVGGTVSEPLVKSSESMGGTVSEPLPADFEPVQEFLTAPDFDGPCSEDYSYPRLRQRSVKNPVLKSDIENMNAHGCIGDWAVKDYINSTEYKVAQRQAREDDPEMNQKSINRILAENKKLIVEELKKSTGCPKPPVVDIPVFWRNGNSVTPNLVNGVVQTPQKGASHVILPKTYFAPFDDYVKKELSKYGVNTTFAHDMGYHLAQGEVHCGTNSARICKP